MANSPTVLSIKLGFVRAHVNFICKVADDAEAAESEKDEQEKASSDEEASEDEDDDLDDDDLDLIAENTGRKIVEVRITIEAVRKRLIKLIAEEKIQTFETANGRRRSV